VVEVVEGLGVMLAVMERLGVMLAVMERVMLAVLEGLGVMLAVLEWLGVMLAVLERLMLPVLERLGDMLPVLERLGDMLPVLERLGVMLAAPDWPFTCTLSRRSCPVAPSVPVEVPRMRHAKPGCPASRPGRAQLMAYQATALGRVAVSPAARVKGPAAPVVEYSSCSVSGPVTERRASRVTDRAE
jgi:hypothetical protein